MINKKKFKSIIKLASLTIKQDSRKVERKKADSYNDKRTHQRNAVNTLGKRSGKFH